MNTEDNNVEMNTEDFKITVKEYLMLDKKISEAEKTIKFLKERKTLLYKNVFKYMVNNQIKQLNLPNGEKFETYKRKTRPSVTKKWVSERLVTYCNRYNLDYDDIYDFIYNPIHRPQIEKSSMKKVKAKNKNKN